MFFFSITQLTLLNPNIIERKKNSIARDSLIRASKYDHFKLNPYFCKCPTNCFENELLARFLQVKNFQVGIFKVKVLNEWIANYSDKYLKNFVEIITWTNTTFLN